MRIQDLVLSAKKSRKRVGRGISAGGGKTAGRGTKGQNSRSGGQRNPGFEGGQNPLFQRLPKQPGFRSFRPKLQPVKTSSLERLSGKTVTHASLLEARIISYRSRGAKLLYDGDVKKAYTIELQAASRKAQDAIERAGGKFKGTPLKSEPKPAKAEAGAKSTNKA